MWYRQDSQYKQIEKLVITVTSIENMLQIEKNEREKVKKDLKKEEEKRKSLENVLTQTYSLLGGSNSRARACTLQLVA